MSRGGVSNRADKFKQASCIEIFFANLNEVHAVLDGCFDVREKIAPPPVGDVAADHSAIV
jgi:hypothetical protein